MCGIFAVIGSSLPAATLEKIAQSGAQALEHRGPDALSTHVSTDGWAAVGFSRLAICDPASGRQPMHDGARTAFAVTNGEIYNHVTLRHTDLDGVELASNSDCEVVLPMLLKYARAGHAHACRHVYNALNGVFASVAFDVDNGRFFAARDAVGVRAMFFGRSRDGALWFASEAKALLAHCATVEPFPPGHFMVGERGRESAAVAQRFYNPMYYRPGWMPTRALDVQKIHDALVTAVKRRLMADVPVGVFISGGLDSSLVAAVAKRHLPQGEPFHSFSCGLAGSPDLAAARKVAAYLGTEHHELTFTVREGIAALRSVIFHLETYDVTTVRASTPMYLLSALCQQYVKVVLSGEGADEVFGGYLYFHNAETERDFFDETVSRVQKLYTADVLRGDRATAAQSLELRVPFLDRDFLDVTMSFAARDKMTGKGKRIEKWPMRYAFSKEFCGEEFLPDDILWRMKEQFSDGVGYSWIDGLKAHCEMAVSDGDMAAAEAVFPHHTPRTKEAYLYRRLFEEQFGGFECSQSIRDGIQTWTPKWSESEDPSGRAQVFHSAAYNKTDTERSQSPSTVCE